MKNLYTEVYIDIHRPVTPSPPLITKFFFGVIILEYNLREISSWGGQGKGLTYINELEVVCSHSPDFR